MKTAAWICNELGIRVLIWVCFCSSFGVSLLDPSLFKDLSRGIVSPVPSNFLGLPPIFCMLLSGKAATKPNRQFSPGFLLSASRDFRFTVKPRERLQQELEVAVEAGGGGLGVLRSLWLKQHVCHLLFVAERHLGRGCPTKIFLPCCKLRRKLGRGDFL